MMVSEPVDFESIHISKVLEKNLLSLYSIRNLYLFGPGYFEEKIEMFLPVDSHLVNEEMLSNGTEKFVDLIVFKVLKKTEEFLVADSKLYFFTIFQLFETPFEMY